MLAGKGGTRQERSNGGGAGRGGAAKMRTMDRVEGIMTMHCSRNKKMENVPYTTECTAVGARGCRRVEIEGLWGEQRSEGRV